MTKRVRLLVLSCVLCMIAAPGAFADLYGTVGVERTGLIRGMDLDIASSASWTIVQTVNHVGLQQLQFTNPSLGGTIPADSYFGLGSTAGFCIDIWDNFPVGPDAPYLYSVVSLDVAPDPASEAYNPAVVPTRGGMGVAKARSIAELLTTNSYNTALTAAAVQVAIWEIIDENHFLWPSGNPWNVSSGQGNFYLDTINGTHGEAEVARLANEMLSELTKTGMDFDRYTALSNGPGDKDVQDFVVVPVPAAFLLGLVGLSVAGVRLRRLA
jgi:hypothetical protein